MGKDGDNIEPRWSAGPILPVSLIDLVENTVESLDGDDDDSDDELEEEEPDYDEMIEDRFYSLILLFAK